VLGEGEGAEEPVPRRGVRRDHLLGGRPPTPTPPRTRVGRYDRITIPREVRKLLGISEGDIIEWVYEDGKIIVRRGV